jgi:hypothetical protein
VIVAVPAPTIVTVVPEIVATAVLLDANVKAPVAFDVGAVNVNAASPNVLLIAVMLPIVGVALPTVINPDNELVAVEHPPVATA